MTLKQLSGHLYLLVCVASTHNSSNHVLRKRHLGISIVGPHNLFWGVNTEPCKGTFYPRIELCPPKCEAGCVTHKLQFYASVEDFPKSVTLVKLY